MPLRLRFPTKDKKGHQPSVSESTRRTSSEEDRARYQIRCPQCSHAWMGRSRSDDQGRGFDPVLSSLGFDFSPVPILVIAPNSTIGNANKIAVTLFSHLVKVYGSLNGIHIGELGVEFQEQRWVTLGMVIEKRRALFLESSGTKISSPIDPPSKRLESGEGSSNASVPSPKSKFSHSSDLNLGGLGRRAADALKGKAKSSKDVESDGNTESFEVMIRFPNGQTPLYQANNRRESFGKTANRRQEEPDKQNTTLVPATLFLSFTDSGKEVYTVMSILTHDSISVAGNAAANQRREKTREMIVPGNISMATEFASQAERVRDSTLEHLDSHFIAMNTRGDITITNSSTRKFFGLESSMPDIGIGRTTSDWVSRLNVYDTKFSTSSPFTEYFHHNLRRKTIATKDSFGVYVKDIPKLMEVSGLPLYAVNTPWVKDLDRELVGYLTMFRDITKQREIDAAQQQDERLRGIFTSGVVSELRTPIAGIVGLLQILNETRLNQEQTTHLMGLLRSVNFLLISIDDIVDFSSFEMRQSVVRAKAFNLFNLIHHVSNLAFLTFSKRDVQFTTDFEGLKSITRYKYEGAEGDEERPLDERMECAMIGDESNARRVLTNILSNAFKYTSEGYVSLRVYVVSTQGSTCRICFEIKDTGIGISEEAGKSIFKPFAEDDETGRKPTDGLGLYVTQKIVKQLGGSLDFFSTLGIGSVFKITFPFIRDSNAKLPGTQGKVEDLLHVTSAILQKDFVERRRVSDPLSLRLPESDGEEEPAAESKKDGPAPTPTPGIVPETGLNPSSLPEVTRTAPSPPTEPEDEKKKPPGNKKRPQYSPAPTRKEPRREDSRESVSSTKAPSNTKGLKVMVVEDNWALQNITKLRLEKLGCEAIIAPNGIDALRLLSTKLAEPDFILMDLQMPLMDGYDTTKNIRSAAEPGLKDFQYIPIIAVTASTLEEDKEKAFKVGMSDYVFKPLGMNVLKELIAKYGTKPAPTSNADGNTGLQPENAAS
ncbi:hypothetical protein TWF569_000258 [Orbilia oligospora]|uniref:histidine kinase n=2 Tax=Orbilia oligospora TaxID=2813651 RepID=A0A7C8K4N4_ORBOL|nr:hypothetical protein TWF103_011815 [Orbilia oligospora]KAF3116372.1 hypothetical protein TWF706_004018 [Orbilia oligospora]KAF3145606.1 hypothetical protein TWF703_006747 [Orbilia oligospora]KAF3154278.1 hypothetical protein TWF569_000258 [Orbilia oligospora]